MSIFPTFSPSEQDFLRFIAFSVFSYFRTFQQYFRLSVISYFCIVEGFRPSNTFRLFSKISSTFPSFPFFPISVFYQVSAISASPTFFGFSYSRIGGLARFSLFQYFPFFGKVSSAFSSFPNSLYYQDFYHFRLSDFFRHFLFPSLSKMPF